jgi:hypothetical protein
MSPILLVVDEIETRPAITLRQKVRETRNLASPCCLWNDCDTPHVMTLHPVMHTIHFLQHPSAVCMMVVIHMLLSCTLLKNDPVVGLGCLRHGSVLCTSGQHVCRVKTATVTLVM